MAIHNALAAADAELFLSRSWYHLPRNGLEDSGSMGNMDEVDINSGSANRHSMFASPIDLPQTRMVCYRQPQTSDPNSGRATPCFPNRSLLGHPIEYRDVLGLLTFFDTDGDGDLTPVMPSLQTLRATQHRFK